MPSPFVWFHHNGGTNLNENLRFLASLRGWRALGLGATLVREKTRGPAGEFSVVRDPGGAALALWKQA